MIVLMVIAGLLAGGLINLLADSLPVNRQLLSPHCHACLAPRPPSAYLAVTAMFTGHWNCAYCGRGLRLRLISVELLLVVAAIWLHMTGAGLLGLGSSLVVFSTFVLLAVTDIEHRLIPHAISLPAIGLVTLLASLDPSRGLVRTVVGGLAGFGIVFILFFLGELYSRWQAKRRGEALDEVAFGFGDVTLATLIGVSVGWPAIVLALMIGVLSAGAFSALYILWMLLRRQYRPHLPIPYGPFLILGGMLVFFGGRDLFSSLLLN